MYIYKITNLMNQKVYIGLDSRSSKAILRWKEHLAGAQSTAAKDVRKILYKAMRKYGVNSFIFEIIEEVDSLMELKSREIFWIKHYNSTNRELGYNRTLGGEAFPWSCMTERERIELGEKISEGVKKHRASLSSSEMIYYKSQLLKGLKRYLKSNSEEWLRRKNEGFFSWYYELSSEERSHNLETMQNGNKKWRQSLSAEEKSRIFKKMVETRQKNKAKKERQKAATTASAMICAKEYDVQFGDGNIFRVKNLSLFCRENDLEPSNMHAVANGKQNQHKGWRCWILDSQGTRLVPSRNTFWNRKNQWTVRDPNGNLHIISNLKIFCIENYLSYSSMRKVFAKKMKQHKGWTFDDI